MTPHSGMLSRNEACFFARVSTLVLDRAIHDEVIKTVKASEGKGAQTFLPDTSVAILVILEGVKRAGIEIAPAWKQRLSHDLDEQLANWSSMASRSFETWMIKVSLSPTVVIQADTEALEALSRARGYVEGRAAWIDSNPGIFGGEPVISGTRITAASVKARLEGGDTLDVLVEDYPEIPRVAFEIADAYARTHPRRGRPVKPWRDDRAA